MTSLRTTNLPTLTHEQLLDRIQELSDSLQRALEEAQRRRATLEAGMPLFDRRMLKQLKRMSDELCGTIDQAIDPTAPRPPRARRVKVR